MRSAHVLWGVAAAFAALVAIVRRRARSKLRHRPSRSTTTTSAASCAGPSGPEAGVWVIAETRDLPVRYIKIVVTDDQGRYVVPDLPKANYDVWVRGYGLVDSPKVKSEPGKQLNLTAVPAPNEAAAAKYYPAIYWYSMMKIPEAEVVRQQGRAAQGQDHRLSQHHEEQRLRRLPSARPAVDAHDSRSST